MQLDNNKTQLEGILTIQAVEETENIMEIMEKEKMDVEAILSLNMIVMNMNSVAEKEEAVMLVTSLMGKKERLFWVISELMAKEVNRPQEVCQIQNIIQGEEEEKRMAQRLIERPHKIRNNFRD